MQSPYILMALELCVGALFFCILIFIIRWKHERDLKPTKKYPQGRLVSEFWHEKGTRHRVLCEISENGQSIIPPSKGDHTVANYFFTKSAVGRTKYPLAAILPFTQIDADIASWQLNNPNAIDPLRKNDLYDAETAGLVGDKRALSTALAVNEEMEDQLKAQLKGKLNATYVYVGLVACILASTVGAVFAYRAYQAFIAATTGKGG